MYNFIKSFVQNNYQWNEIDVRTESMGDLITNYQNVYFIVYEGTGTTPLQFSLGDNKGLVTTATWDMDLVDWLGALPEGTLRNPVTKVGPQKYKSCMFRDVSYFNFRVERSNADYGEGREIPIGEDVDLKIESKEMDSTDSRHMSNLKHTGLFFINGQAVQHEYRNDTVFIRNAFKRFANEEEVKVSVMDFSNLGEVEFIPFTSDMLTIAPQSGIDLSRGEYRVAVDLGVNLSEYTAFVVLDGHLHVLDETYKMIDATKLQLTLNTRDIAKKAVRFPTNALKYLSPVNLMKQGFRLDYLDPEGLLVMCDSMVILVKNTRIAIHKENLTPSTVLGSYSHYRMPNGPIFFEDYTVTPYTCGGFNQYRVGINTLPNLKKDLAIEHVEEGKAITTTGTYKHRKQDPLFQAFCLDIYEF